MYFEPKPLFSDENDNKVTENISLNEPKILNIDETKNVKLYEPKGLNIASETPIVKGELGEKSFLYSYDYLKNKIPSIKKEYYTELTIILPKINRINRDMQDNDVSEIGKKMQKELGDFTRDYVGESSISNLINEINMAHKEIVNKISENTNIGNDFLGFIKNKLQNKQSSIKLNSELLIRILNDFVYTNITFKTSLDKSLNKFEYIENEIDNLTNKFNFYLDFLTFLEEDFKLEGFVCNINLINNRKENIMASGVMFSTTKMILKTQKDKIYLLLDNIDNVVNILIPTYISKLKISELGDNTLNELAQTIILKLNSERI